MKFRKRHIYRKKEHILPNWPKEKLLVYTVFAIVLSFMFFFSVKDSKMYRTSIMSANDALLVLKYAGKQIGKPYELGSTGDTTFDCSGLTLKSFEQIGVELPRISRDQAKIGKTISLEEARAGDLIFMDTYDKGYITHVGIIAGRNKEKENKLKIIHANSYDNKVKSDTLSGKYWDGVIRNVQRINSLTKDMTNNHEKFKEIEEEETTPPLPPSEPTLEQLEELKKKNSSSVVEFSDVDNNYPFKKAIETLANQNIIKGIGNNKFGPFMTLTRAELLKISFNMFKTSQIGKSTNLTDIDRHWVEPYVKTAVAKGYIKGYDDNTFKPDKTVSRAEAAKIIMEIAKIADNYNYKETFSDIDSNDWKIKYASIIKREKLLPLDGNTFNPDAGLTRGEAVALIYNIDKM